MTTINDTTAPAESVYAPYGAIVTQLLEVNRCMRAKMIESGANTTYSQKHWFREFCTVRIGGCRQTGMTRSIAELLIPRTLVIVKDDTMRAAIYEKTYQRLKDERLLIKLLDGRKDALMAFPMSTVQGVLDSIKNRPRQTLQITLDEDDPNPHDTVERLMSEFRAKNAAQNKRSESAGFVRFIVDDASFVFERIPIKDFYRWAETHACGDSPEFIFLN